MNLQNPSKKLIKKSEAQFWRREREKYSVCNSEIKTNIEENKGVPSGVLSIKLQVLH